MKRFPNDSCWCDSGRKYKKCHKAFDDAPEERKYAEAQRLYASTWTTTAQLQHDRGDYDWMAQQLKPYTVERLFDVGCGSGHGLLALAATLPAPLRIVAVDENLDCLRIARDTLANAGLSPHMIARLDCAHTPLGFIQDATPFAGPLPQPLALLEADPMTDPYLEDALRADGPFDAVTIWLTGAHMWRRMNFVSRARGVGSEHDLRILLQNEVYELADRILRPGGVLQVVDRAEAPTTDFLHNAYIQAHGEQAEPTTLEVREIAYRPWSEPAGGTTQMIFTTPEGRETIEPEIALVSIISVKA
ncbi:MAG TPA: SEC-C metal-binding domain-containing protein [Allosphingosinicella sp.]|jgi:SAM-dependent methyltransferase|nr:SEC-C metal-binding domain-containing protein [Allosphingosinicella sp.]